VEQSSKPDTKTTNELSTGDSYALAIERHQKNHFPSMEQQACSSSVCLTETNWAASKLTATANKPWKQQVYVNPGET